MLETTLALIKPDATRDGLIPPILRDATAGGLVIGDMVMSVWTRELVGQFYHEHKDRPFFNDLLVFMSSGPVVAFTLVGEDALLIWRDRMGATDPRKAALGTIRRSFGSKTGPIMHNCVHGSDDSINAAREIELLRIAFGYGSGYPSPVLQFGSGAEALR